MDGPVTEGVEAAAWCGHADLPMSYDVYLADDPPECLTAPAASTRLAGELAPRTTFPLLTLVLALFAPSVVRGAAPWLSFADIENARVREFQDVKRRMDSNTNIARRGDYRSELLRLAVKLVVYYSAKSNTSRDSLHHDVFQRLVGVWLTQAAIEYAATDQREKASAGAVLQAGLIMAAPDYLPNLSRIGALQKFTSAPTCAVADTLMASGDATNSVRVYRLCLEERLDDSRNEAVILTLQSLGETFMKTGEFDAARSVFAYLLERQSLPIERKCHFLVGFIEATLARDATTVSDGNASREAGLLLVDMRDKALLSGTHMPEECQTQLDALPRGRDDHGTPTR